MLGFYKVFFTFCAVLVGLVFAVMGFWNLLLVTSCGGVVTTDSGSPCAVTERFKSSCSGGTGGLRSHAWEGLSRDLPWGLVPLT